MDNPDGNGDEMCEDGVCYATGWKENIKDLIETITALTQPAPEKP